MGQQSAVKADPTTRDYRRIKTLLCSVAELDPEQRLCEARRELSDEPDVLTEVLAMLEGIAGHEEFLEQGVTTLAGLADDPLETGALAAQGPARTAGTRFGPFVLGERISEGGMAVVYRARALEPVEREVALKVISVHATSSQKARFERECSLLARLSHPNVATLYEAGVSPEGEPFAVMELIHGLPISQWCRERKLPFRDRLALLIDACKGIAHAHRNGIIHRDIKPSNLLVADVDGEPVVKVIDFGIAAALADEAGEVTSLTGRRLIGTPAYMSPEAVRHRDRQALDARSDVFALGLLLFELMCGKRPFDFHQGTLAEWFQVLSSREPDALGSVLRSMSQDEKDALAASTGCAPQRLGRFLGSDLEAIARKALSLEPDRRYASSLDLAQDLQAYLDGRAVTARAPNKTYLLGRFLRRHWVGAAATALVVLSAMAGLVARELEARQTRAALMESQAASEFIVDLLEQASPTRMQSDEVTLRDIIDRGAAEIDQRFQGRPLIRARLLHTFGRVYGERGALEESTDLLSRSIKLLEEADLAGHAEHLGMVADYAGVLRRQGQLDKAERLLRQTLRAHPAVLDEHPTLLADLSSVLGNVLHIRKVHGEAQELHERALDLRERHLPAGDPLINVSRNNLTSVLINSGQYEQALPHTQRLLADWERSLPEGHPWIGLAQNNLSIALEFLGRRDEALILREQSLQNAQHRLGPDHPMVADIWTNIGHLLRDSGQLEPARSAYLEAHQIMWRTQGEHSPRTLEALRVLASPAVWNRDYEAALAAYNDIRNRLDSERGDRNLLVRVELDRAEALVGLMRIDEARQAMSVVEDAVGPSGEPGSALRFRINRVNAMIHGASGDHEKAVALLVSTLDEAELSLSIGSRSLGRILSELTRQLLAADRYGEAVAYGRQALSSWEKSNRRVDVANSHLLLGKACLAAAMADCGQEHLQAAELGFSAILPADHPDRIEAAELAAAHDPGMNRPGSLPSEWR